MQPSANPEVSPLVDAVPSLRSLARRLATDDPTRADDLVQDTLLAALRRPPEEPRNIAPWLTRVVRNLAHTAKRSEVRRRRWERFATAARDGDDPVEAASSSELVRRVRREVLILREPYRSVVTLCYLDGLEPAEIAARRRVPAATVRSQLKRGLELLRHRLQVRDDGPQTWRRVLGLVSLLRPQIRCEAAIPILVGAAIAAVSLGLFASRTQPQPTPPSSAFADSPADEAAVATTGSTTSASLPIADRLRVSRRSSVPTAEVDATVSSLATPRADRGHWTLRGRLLGLDPRPPCSTQLEVHGLSHGSANQDDPAESTLVSLKSDGSFTADVTSWLGDSGVVALVVELDDPAYLPARRVLPVADETGLIPPPPTVFEADLQVVLAGIVFGQVIDQRGAAVTSATLTAFPSADGVVWPGPMCETTETDADGRFRLRTAGRGEYSVRVESRRRFLPTQRQCLVHAGSEVSLGVLVVDRGIEFSGSVVDAEGLPVSRALIHVLPLSPEPETPAHLAAGFTVKSNDGGRFSLGGLAPDRYSVCALSRDGLPYHPQLATQRPGAITVEAGADVRLQFQPSLLVVSCQTAEALTGKRRFKVSAVEAPPPTSATPPAPDRPSSRPLRGLTSATGELRAYVAAGTEYRVEVIGVNGEIDTLQAKVPEHCRESRHSIFLTHAAIPEGDLIVRLLRDDTSRTPVSSAWFCAVPIDRGLPPRRVGLSSTNGVFQLDSLPTGRYDVHVLPGTLSRQGLSLFLDETFNVTIPERGSAEIDVALRLGGRLDARAIDARGLGLHAHCELRDALGNPLPTTWVLHSDLPQPLYYQERLWQHGFASPVGALPPGDYSLEVWLDDHGRTTSDFEIVSGEVTSLRIVLPGRD